MTMHQPAHVLFLHPSDELYGADTSLLYLLRGLDRARFQPFVILANDLAYSGLLSKELAAAGIPVMSLPIAVARRTYLSPTGLAAFLRRVRGSVRIVSEIIERESIDNVHTNTLAVWTGALAAKRAGRPHVWHIRESLQRPKQLVMLMRRFVPSHSARVVGVSQAVLDDILVTPEARAKGTVIYNGEEPQPFMHAAGREAIRQELGIGPDDVVAGMIARVSKMKAPDLSVRAASRLMNVYPKLHVFIAGGPVPGQTQPLHELRQLVAESPAPQRFHLLGERRDAPDLMAALDILAAPSRYGEGASRTILQGMFAAKPVIATDVGGNKELVQQNQTGFIIPSENVDALAQRIDILLRNEELRATMGRAGQEYALAHFTIDRTISAFNDLLWSVYADRGAGSHS